jgi:hypothetical protein
MDIPTSKGYRRLKTSENEKSASRQTYPRSYSQNDTKTITKLKFSTN